ncbi:MAG: 1-phosphofructokinase [Halapricum sp.]
MILTITLNPAVDHTLAVDVTPRPDIVNRATRGGQFDAGGKGINVSQFLAALDADTVAMGVLGGFTGEFIRTELSEEPFESVFVTVAEPTRVNTTVLAADGEYKFNERGPHVADSAVDELVSWISALSPDRVAVAGSLPPGLDAGTIDRLAQAGPWRTNVDVGGAMLTELAATYETCKPNREELAEAVGHPVESVEDAVEAARELLAMGYERVVTSLGADGAVLVTGETALYADAVETDVVDTVGAGDSLFAGVLAALDDGADEATALKRGIALAGLVVSQPGTTAPSIDDPDALGEEVTVRSVTP